MNLDLAHQALGEITQLRQEVTVLRARCQAFDLVHALLFGHPGGQGGVSVSAGEETVFRLQSYIDETRKEAQRVEALKSGVYGGPGAIRRASELGVPAHIQEEIRRG